jgi:hypothetical protein
MATDSKAPKRDDSVVESKQGSEPPPRKVKKGPKRVEVGERGDDVVSDGRDSREAAPKTRAPERQASETLGDVESGPTTESPAQSEPSDDEGLSAFVDAAEAMSRGGDDAGSPEEDFGIVELGEIEGVKFLGTTHREPWRIPAPERASRAVVLSVGIEQGQFYAGNFGRSVLEWVGPEIAEMASSFAMRSAEDLESLQASSGLLGDVDLRDHTAWAGRIILVTTEYEATGRGQVTVDHAVATSLSALGIARTLGSGQVVLPVLGAGWLGLDGREVVRGLVRAIRERAEGAGGSPFPERIILSTVDAGVLEAARRALRGVGGALTQALANDLSGEDLIGIRDEVFALTDAIALNEMNPPLVVGVLGGWGMGKTFVMDLMEERLREIRAIDLHERREVKETNDDGVVSKRTVDARRDSPFVGHPFVIKFNAWTFAKANLWASFMQTIFFELDRQLVLERLTHDVAKQLNRPVLDSIDIWRRIIRLEGWEQRDVLEAADDEIARAIDSKRKPGSEAPTTLWGELQKVREDELEDLKAKEQKLTKARERMRLEVDAEVAREAKREAWRPAAEKLAALLHEIAEPALGDGIEKGGPITLVELKERVGVLSRFVLGVRSGGWAFVAFVVPFLASAAGVLGIALDWFDLGPMGGLPVLTAVLTGTGALVEPFRRATDLLRQPLEEYDEQRREVAQRLGEQREELEERYRKKNPNLADLESEVTKRRAQIGMTASHASLTDFVTRRLEEDDYATELGHVHRVQEDLAELTEALLRHARANGTEPSTPFPRGEPRIFLMIDDLDRCPPETVVQVLEAAQLLVKTRLFVVILAMDVRYVTKSLEKEYEGVLERNDEPSGLDYIEKIVQIPYRVRPIPRAAMKSFVEGLTTPGGAASRTGSAIATAPSPPPGPDPAQHGPDSDGEGRGDSPPPPPPPLPPPPPPPTPPSALDLEVLEISDREQDLLVEAGNLFASSARAMKRLVNVMKLLKLLWHTTGEPTHEIKGAVLGMLAIAAKFPEESQQLIRKLERDVLREETGQSKLSDWLDTQCEGRTGRWNQVAEIARFGGDVTLEQLGSANARLISRFSFVVDRSDG